MVYFFRLNVCLSMVVVSSFTLAPNNSIKEHPALAQFPLHELCTPLALRFNRRKWK